MPIVTATPVTIDPANFSRQSGVEANPFYFQLGTNLYAILSYGVSPSSTVGAYLSTNSGSSWAEQDIPHHPTSVTNAVYCYYDGTLFQVLCQDSATSQFFVQTFNPSTGLWGTAGTKSSFSPVPPVSPDVVWYQQTGGTQVLVLLATTTIYYGTLSSGTWSALTNLTTGANPFSLVAGFSGISDIGYFAVVAFPVSTSEATVSHYSLSLGFSLSAPITMSTTDGGSRGTIIVNTTGSGSVQYSWTDNGNQVVYTSGTPLATPSFTRTVVATVAGASGGASYATLFNNPSSQLQMYYVYYDSHDFSSVVDQVLVSTLASGSWSAAIVYYDAVANPPPLAQPPATNFIHTLQLIQVASGSTIALCAMEVEASGEVCAGFALLGASSGTLTATFAASGATLGLAYSSGFVASGGTPPYSFALIVGSFPPGLTLNGVTGALTGTPNTLGTFNYTVLVTDANGLQIEKIGPITVGNLTVACLVGPFTIGVPYSGMFVVTGGFPPFTFSITSGTLPPGLTLNPATGIVSGTPTTAGVFTYTVGVTSS